MMMPHARWHPIVGTTCAAQRLLVPSACASRSSRSSSSSSKRVGSSIARASSTRSSSAAALQEELLQLLDGTQRGLTNAPGRQEAILQCVAGLKAAAAPAAVTTSDTLLSATWQLLWTTEKETLWIVQNAGWFGTRAGDVLQVIDVAGQQLQNVITFPPDGAFIVDSAIAVEGPQRTSFKFSSAKLKTASRDWSVPPFGQGWFDTVWVSGEGKGAIRIAQDIRGDTLIVQHDGPPRIFS